MIVKMCVFSLDLKISADLELLMDCGKLLKAVGSATANERSLNLNVVLRTTKSPRISEQISHFDFV